MPLKINPKLFILPWNLPLPVFKFDACHLTALKFQCVKRLLEIHTAGGKQSCVCCCYPSLEGVTGMLRKRKLYSCNMIKIGEDESGPIGKAESRD